MNVRTYLSKGQMLNVWLSVAIIVLVVIIIADNVQVWFKLLQTDKPIGLNDGRDEVFCPVIPADAPPDARP
jgi:carbon starvation protein